MSCHDIGRGMNSVTIVVLNLYEEGLLSQKAAKDIIRACRKGVNWCDGNEDEAVEETRARGYCGLCFEKSDILMNVYDDDSRVVWRTYDDNDDIVVHQFICPKCRQRLIDGHLEDCETSSSVELTGNKCFDDRIRNLASGIAASRGLTVDEFLNTVCCSSGPGYETTYGQLYAATFLEGFNESRDEACAMLAAEGVFEQDTKSNE